MNNYLVVGRSRKTFESFEYKTAAKTSKKAIEDWKTFWTEIVIKNHCMEEVTIYKITEKTNHKLKEIE